MLSKSFQILSLRVSRLIIFRWRSIKSFAIQPQKRQWKQYNQDRIIYTYWMSLVVPEGKIFGSRSWHMDWTQHFILWPLSVENFSNFVLTLTGLDRRAQTRKPQKICYDKQILKKNTFYRVFFELVQETHK